MLIRKKSVFSFDPKIECRISAKQLFFDDKVPVLKCMLTATNNLLIKTETD